MTHPTTPEQPHPNTGYRPASSARSTVRIVAAVLASITATLALAWLITAAAAAPARGDALCDAMRARFGPGYPCISVPTNTFTPTAPAGPTTTNPNGSTGSGPGVGIDTGPGPGIGNGTPIVPVPGEPTAPGTNPAPAATPTTPQLPAGPTQPGQQTGQPAPQTTQPPPSTSARPPAPSTTPAPAPVGTTEPTQRASIPSTDDNTSDEITQMLWLLGGAAAIVAGASTARSGGVGRYRAAATANGYPTITSALRSWLPGGTQVEYTETGLARSIPGYSPAQDVGNGPNGTGIRTPPAIASAGTRQGAVNFANKYANGYGNYDSYFNRQGNDCTNFISNALHYGGGFTPDTGGNISSTDRTHWAHGSDISSQGLNPSAAWAAAGDFENYLANGWGNPNAPHGTVVQTITTRPNIDPTDPLALTHAGLQPGDLVFYDWHDGEGGISHAAIYTGQKVLQDPNTHANVTADVVDYHTNDRLQQYWALANNDTGNGPVTYTLVHLRYPGE